MASEHRIIRVNDRDPKRTRLRRYRRVYRGDVIRVSRVTDKPTNQVVQEFGLPSETKLSVNTDELMVLQPNMWKGTSGISSPLGEGRRTAPTSPNPTPPFTPLEYNPSLWLDNSDRNAIIDDGTDTVSLLDKSEGLVETNVY